MARKIVITILIIVVLLAAYFILGYLGFVPLYHCDTAMGPNGLVHWCEWYPGRARIY